jgi:hypothetical protein
LARRGRLRSGLTHHDASDGSARQIFCVALPAFTQPSMPSGMTATFV